MAEHALYRPQQHNTPFITHCKLACVRHLPQCAVLSTMTPYTPEAPIAPAYTPDICNASGEFQSSASMARLRQQDESGDHC